MFAAQISIYSSVKKNLLTSWFCTRSINFCKRGPACSNCNKEEKGRKSGSWSSKLRACCQTVTILLRKSRMCSVSCLTPSSMPLFSLMCRATGHARKLSSSNTARCYSCRSRPLISKLPCQISATWRSWIPCPSCAASNGTPWSKNRNSK